MIEIAPGWSMELERGPDWLFVKLRETGGLRHEAPLASALWTRLQQEFTYRLVIELDELPVLPSWLIGQFMMLHKRISKHEGLLRLCGVSDSSRQMLLFNGLDAHLPIYLDRAEAVMGHRPNKPR